VKNFKHFLTSTCIMLCALAFTCSLPARSAPDVSQVYMRVTLGDCYEKPVFVYVWVTHYNGGDTYSGISISKNGLVPGLVEPTTPDSFYQNNESTGWVNITHKIRPDTGALLTISARNNSVSPLIGDMGYSASPFTGDLGYSTPRFKADIAFATEPKDDCIVKTFHVDATPGNEYISVPPNLSPENLPNLRSAEEIAAATGKIADAMQWPKFGKKPVLFPYLLAANPEGANGFPPDRKVTEREQKTIDYFGFSNKEKIFLAVGTWRSKGPTLCYSQPDVEAMKANLITVVASFKKSGKTLDNIANCILTDEVGGQNTSHIVNCPACIESFKQWMKELKKTPEDLGVTNWDEVKPVYELQAESYPTLFYYTEKFRVRAWSKFMRVQRELIASAFGGNIPVDVNSSDGPTTLGNSSALGQDNFELLENSDDQNAMFGEDWAGGAAANQCSTFNVELMRSAAMKRGQSIGHYLISYYGRLPWDIKLNAVSMLARDVKHMVDFYYGPSWYSAEAGPVWKSSAWYAKPENWNSEAEIVREIGGAEDLLYPAKKKKAEVAILYSFTSDIWSVNFVEDKFMPLTADRTDSYGFDRMFLWLALTHANIPVDFISENRVAEGGLKGYKACYYTGRNLSKDASEKLAEWVKSGGTLVTMAGAGAKDEFNRPMGMLESILPAAYGKLDVFQPFQSLWNARGGILSLSPKEHVTMAKNGAKLAVLSVKQELLPKPGSQILGTFANGSAAIVMKKSGKGTVCEYGFLPGLSYIWPAVVMQQKVSDNVKKSGLKQIGIPDPTVVLDETDLSRRSWSPWQYPSEVRDVIASSALQSKADTPVLCSVPLVDAVCMETGKGIVVPLANYTLQPISSLSLAVEAKKKVSRVESVHHGNLVFKQKDGRVTFSLPLLETDFVKLYY